MKLWNLRVSPPAAVLTIYVVTTIFTNAIFMADTADYVDSVTAYVGGRNYDFWEFGHLFWRPLGWLTFAVFAPLARVLVGSDVRLDVTFALMLLTWLGGALSVIALYTLIQLWCKRTWVAVGVTVAFIFSHGFLNFTQTGCAYSLGLALLMFGMCILARGSERPADWLKTATFAGLAFAAGTACWIPYVLTVPAAIVSPMFLRGFDKSRWRLVAATGVAFGGFIVLAYAIVAIAALGITDVAGFHKWVSAASHDTDIRGVTRMVFGFARSFIYMGNDGMLFKRYLLHDPFNPVTLGDLVRLSLWKFLLFYLFLGAIVLRLALSTRGRTMLALFLLNAIPVLALAILFDGGAVERYLPLYPLLFLSVAVAFSESGPMPALKYVAVAFAAAMIVGDATAMGTPTLNHQQELTAARIAGVLSRLQPNSRVLAVNWQDDLVNFSRSAPFHPINRAGNLRINALVTPGTTETSHWRDVFASQAFDAWEKHGEVWVSRRAWAARPRPEWNWAEGDDQRVSWADFPVFFAQLELGESVAGDDGFILIPDTARNRAVLAALMGARTESQRETFQ